MTCKYSIRCKDFEHYLYPCSGYQKEEAVPFCWRYKKYRREECVLSVNICREINNGGACSHLKPKQLSEGVFDGRVQLCGLSGLQPRFMYECPLEAK